MSEAPDLSRRAVLRGLAGFAGGLILAACSPATTPGTGKPATPGTGTPSPTAPPGSATASVPLATSGPSATTAGTSLRQKIARLLIVGFRGLTVDDAPWLRTAIAEDGLGGVILFDRDQTTGGARNVKSPTQVRALTADLRALAPDRELIIAIDQEGGVVTRLSPKWGYPSVASQASIGEKDDAAIKAWAAGIAATLADAGINYNLAPVVDVNVNPTNPAVGALDRSFSPDADTVAHDAALEIEAHRNAGVRTALKHFPGLGSATTNTDFGVADVTDTWTVSEIDPYGELLVAGLVDSIMIGNLVNGQIDPNAPASLSSPTVNVSLRKNLGWNGVCITDDLGAAAITEAFGFEDAIGLALEAGNDLLLFANQQAYDAELAGKVIDVIEGFVGSGRISEARIDASIASIDALFAPG